MSLWEYANPVKFLSFSARSFHGSQQALHFSSQLGFIGDIS